MFERPVEDAYPNLCHFVRAALEGQGKQHKGEQQNNAGGKDEPVNQVADNQHIGEKSVVGRPSERRCDQVSDGLVVCL